MEITALEVQNVKRVSAVTIKPDGAPLVIVGGKNSSGKTSTISSIAMAIGGKRLCPQVPVRKGETYGRVGVTLSNGLVVTREFYPGGSELKIQAEDGRDFKSPQAILNSLTSQLGFDPLEFTRMKSDKQGRLLCELCGIDTASIDEERDRLYKERTRAGQEKRKAAARLDALAEPPRGAPMEHASVAALVEELKRRTKVNQGNAELRAELRRTRVKYGDLEAEIASMESKLSAKKSELRAIADAGQELRSKVEASVEQDEKEIQEQIEEVESRNKQVDDNRQWTRLARELGDLEGETERLTEEIQCLDNQRDNMLTNAKYPVPGMRVDQQGQVLLDDLPFEQASSAQQLRASVTIGLALNPELRVMIIYDGSLLDEDSLAVLAQAAKEADAQLWIERVSEGKECTVIIEDGMVKGDG
jgi:predicted  nucleic acid-binding Zn-ribbon protein